ncbi:PrgI family protein [Jeotgalibacillus campisalis]|uniref:Uncharacterized protein n=1 Tax=Jeotgalibacillus campisalis TaxID=220754 RepID=A0A0C2W9L8_9BACL|nr:PrgI family protein [Jeotgalibacillus campisalis]KIL52743.1 hypothetical protein KR50_00720 [Jeotgalibacillus campisalis]
MINFIIAIAVGVGVFLGIYLISGSAGISALVAVIATVIAVIAVGFYTGQRKEQISKNEEVPLQKDRTPENANKKDYNPDDRNENRIKDPGK